MAALSCLCSLAISSFPLPMPYSYLLVDSLTGSHIKRTFSFLCLGNMNLCILALQTCFVLKKAQGFQCQPHYSKEVDVQGAQLLRVWAFLLSIIFSYCPANISVSL